MSDSTHNPDQYMFGFRQLASNGKKKIGVLMGAGAPVSINIGPSNDDWISLIPNLQGLTKTVKENLSAKELKVYQDLEESILNPNLEKVLSKIRALNEVIGDSIVYGCNSTEFLELSEKICNLIRDAVSKELPPGQTPYSELVSWINGVNRKHGVEVFTTNYD